MLENVCSTYYEFAGFHVQDALLLLSKYESKSKYIYVFADVFKQQQMVSVRRTGAKQNPLNLTSFEKVGQLSIRKAKC